MSEIHFGNFDGVEIYIDKTVTPGMVRLFCFNETEVRTYHSEEEFKETKMYKKWFEEYQEFKSYLEANLRMLGITKYDE